MISRQRGVRHMGTSLLFAASSLALVGLAAPSAWSMAIGDLLDRLGPEGDADFVCILEVRTVEQLTEMPDLDPHIMAEHRRWWRLRLTGSVTEVLFDRQRAAGGSPLFGSGDQVEFYYRDETRDISGLTDRGKYEYWHAAPGPAVVELGKAEFHPWIAGEIFGLESREGQWYRRLLHNLALPEEARTDSLRASLHEFIASDWLPDERDSRQFWLIRECWVRLITTPGWDRPPSWWWRYEPLLDDGFWSLAGDQLDPTKTTNPRLRKFDFIAQIAYLTRIGGRAAQGLTLDAVRFLDWLTLDEYDEFDRAEGSIHGYLSEIAGGRWLELYAANRFARALSAGDLSRACLMLKIWPKPKALQPRSELPNWVLDEIGLPLDPELQDPEETERRVLWLTYALPLRALEYPAPEDSAPLEERILYWRLQASALSKCHDAYGSSLGYCLDLLERRLPPAFEEAWPEESAKDERDNPEAMLRKHQITAHYVAIHNLKDPALFPDAAGLLPRTHDRLREVLTRTALETRSKDLRSEILRVLSVYPTDLLAYHYRLDPESLGWGEYPAPRPWIVRLFLEIARNPGQAGCGSMARLYLRQALWAEEDCARLREAGKDLLVGLSDEEKEEIRQFPDRDE